MLIYAITNPGSGIAERSPWISALLNSVWGAANL
jgi:hypothetical protein